MGSKEDKPASLFTVFWPRVKRKTENRSVNSQKCPGRNSGCFYLSLFRLAAVTPLGAF
jgi:hypothetical protein